MSDEVEVPSTPPVEAVPPPPAPPETPETPQTDSAGTEDISGDQDAEGVPEDATGATEGQEEAAAAAPVVETTASGQTVTFPDSGRVVHTRSGDYPVSNAEWAEYELTHQGDQPRYASVPGDKDYSPYSDPNVPNSHLAQQVESEIAGYAERVLTNPDAEVSYIWNALHGVHVGELDTAIASGGGSGKAMA